MRKEGDEEGKEVREMKREGDVCSKEDEEGDEEGKEVRKMKREGDVGGKEDEEGDEEGKKVERDEEGGKEVFYLTTHSTHLGMVIWRRTYGKGPFR